jgi:hypothetical protein
MGARGHRGTHPRRDEAQTRQTEGGLATSSSVIGCLRTGGIWNQDPTEQAAMQEIGKLRRQGHTPSRHRGDPEQPRAPDAPRYRVAAGIGSQSDKAERPTAAREECLKSLRTAFARSCFPIPAAHEIPRSPIPSRYSVTGPFRPGTRPRDRPVPLSHCQPTNLPLKLAVYQARS